MPEKELLDWLDDLVKRGRVVPSGDRPGFRLAQPAATWLGEALAALSSFLPPEHALYKQWTAIFERAKTAKWGGSGIPVPEPHYDDHFQQAIGVIGAAATLVRNGRLKTLLDGIRAETVVEVLDQADMLLKAKHHVAAAVLAGGALETHLLHLCARNGLTPPGEGSISKYDQAIAKARNAGTVEVYSAGDTKSVTKWGDTRNAAAHSPTTFTSTPAEVGIMIDGIRQFIARVA